MAKPEKQDELPESVADERFRRGIENALATPPKPHKPPTEKQKHERECH